MGCWKRRGSGFREGISIEEVSVMGELLFSLGSVSKPPSIPREALIEGCAILFLRTSFRARSLSCLLAQLPEKIYISL
jgi:hypothetical protein